MNLILGELPDRLAAEYVLGTLTGGARRRFDALLPAHPALRRAVSGWEARMLPLALKAEPVAPAAAVWNAIEGKLGWSAEGAASSAAKAPAKGLLRFWQAFSGLATVAALVLGVMLRTAPTEAPMIVVLRATQGTETLVAGLSPDRQQLTIQPLQKVALTAQQSLELWALPKSGPPASLGVISSEKLTALSKKALPRDTKGLAVTLEPLGGSPTGAPTGRIVFVGDLTL
ncbi:MAG: anti-sigma factor [Betaproteobacteria bacterium]